MSDFNNYLAYLDATKNREIGNCCSNEGMSIEEARLKIMEHSAQEWLRIIEQNKYINREVHLLSDELRKKDYDLEEKTEILNKYIETFGKYEIVEERYATSFRKEKTIKMPETNSYKFYKKVFNDDTYWNFSIPAWKIINLSIEVLDWSYQILSRKVKDKKVKEEKISTKTTKKWKIK